jgi:hypothetical protein
MLSREIGQAGFPDKTNRDDPQMAAQNARLSGVTPQPNDHKGSTVKRLPLTLAGLVLVFHATAGASQTLNSDSVIDRVIETYGIVFPLNGFMIQGSLMNHSRGESALMARLVNGSQSFKMGIHYSTGAEIRISEGNRAWRGTGSSQPEEVHGPLLAATLAQAARSAFPWYLEQMRHHVTIAEADSAVIVLAIVVAEGITIEARIDAENYHVIETTSRVRVGSMELAFKVEFSDFRTVSGVLFPFHEETYAQGTHTASLTVESVVINPVEDTTIFRFEA